MSRFKKLNTHLGFAKAFSFYCKMKSGKLTALATGRLKHPFAIRNNPFDYATFEEVLLEETYNISIPFVPEYLIDGGGNIGLTACYFATKYPTASIISVEPDSDNYKILQQNCGRYPNIKTMQCGIWKNNTHLKIEDTSIGNNAFTVTETTEKSGATIQAVTIQHIMEKFAFPHIDILKLDIEGSEKEVFENGFEHWLPKTKIIIIELHDKMKPGCSKAVFNAIGRYNFSFDIKGENIIFTNNSFK